MKQYKVKLNKRAFRDVEQIFEYIALEKLAPENAKAQTDRIWAALKTLETFPQSHQERLEGKYGRSGYRQLVVDNYLAIFKIDEKTQQKHF